MTRFRRRRVTALSINRMIPNALTLLALCSGLTAIRFALQDRWEVAVVAVLVATVKLGAVANVQVHYGLYLFAAAVLLTMAATAWVMRLAEALEREAGA